MSIAPSRQRDLTIRLARAGFPAPDKDARELVDAANGDPTLLESWARRRLDGEPLAWLTGSVMFSGNRVRVDRGVYVPRPQTELLATRAIDLLPADGLAADLCTGSGAIAVALATARPTARVLATDIDAAACRCARSNGVEVYEGHLADPLPHTLDGRVDVVVAVVPYVPSEEIIYLPRDVRRYEPRRALDGGRGGTEILRQVVWSGRRLLRAGGSLLLELGGDQDEAVFPMLHQAGFTALARLADDEGDLRGIEARHGDA